MQYYDEVRTFGQALCRVHHRLSRLSQLTREGWAEKATRGDESFSVNTACHLRDADAYERAREAREQYVC